MHENMTFVMGKLNIVSYQFVLDVSPLRLKKSFGLQNIVTYIHNVNKGHLGSWVGQGCKG